MHVSTATRNWKHSNYPVLIRFLQSQYQYIRPLVKNNIFIAILQEIENFELCPLVFKNVTFIISIFHVVSVPVVLPWRQPNLCITQQGGLKYESLKVIYFRASPRDDGVTIRQNTSHRQQIGCGFTSLRYHRRLLHYFHLTGHSAQNSRVTHNKVYIFWKVNKCRFHISY